MIITSMEEYETALEQIDELYRKGFSDLTDDEQEELDELSAAVELWELDHDDID